MYAALLKTSHTVWCLHMRFKCVFSYVYILVLDFSSAAVHQPSEFVSENMKFSSKRLRVLCGQHFQKGLINGACLVKLSLTARLSICSEANSCFLLWAALNGGQEELMWWWEHSTGTERVIWGSVTNRLNSVAIEFNGFIWKNINLQILCWFVFTFFPNNPNPSQVSFKYLTFAWLNIAQGLFGGKHKCADKSVKAECSTLTTDHHFLFARVSFLIKILIKPQLICVYTELNKVSAVMTFSHSLKSVQFWVICTWVFTFSAPLFFHSATF